MKIIDITDKVNFDLNDSEHLPLTKCICGQEFKAWNFMLSVYKEYPAECPNCKRKLFFQIDIKVCEIKE